MTLSCELPTPPSPPPSTPFPILKKMIACFVSLSFFFSEVILQILEKLPFLLEFKT